MEDRAQQTRKRAWLGGFAALAALAFWRLAWVQPDESLLAETEHFFFVQTNTSPPIALALAGWLLVRRRAALARIAARGESSPGLGAALLLAGALSFVWAHLVDVPELLVFPLIAVGLGAAAFWWGRGTFPVLAWPAVVLLFAVPFPAPVYNQVIFPLQIVTTHYAASLLAPLGIPAFVSGDQILLADKSFQVIEGCSGFRSIQTLTLVAILYVDLFYRSRLQAGLLIALAPLLAFGLNGVRILTMMLNPYSEIVSVHALQGIVVLLGGLGILYGLDLALERWELSRGRLREIPEAPEAPTLRLPGAPRLAEVAALLAVLAAVGFVRPSGPIRGRDVPPVEAALPERVGDFQPVAERPPADPAFYGKAVVSTALRRRYRSGDHTVDVFVGYWDRSQPAASPFSPKNGYPGSGWLTETENSIALGSEDGAGPPLRASIRQVRRWTARRLVLAWAEGQGSLLSETLRSLVAWDRRPWGGDPASFVVRISTDLGPGGSGRADAEARLRAFARALRVGLEPLERASGGREKDSPKSAGGFGREAFPSPGEWVNSVGESAS